MGRQNLLLASLLGAVAGPLLSDAFSVDRSAGGAIGVVRPRPQQLQVRASHGLKGDATQRWSSNGGAPSSAFASTPSPLNRCASHLSASASPSAESTPSSSSAEPPILGGTETFESWFTSKSVGGKQQSGLRHATFQSDTLRGLEYSGPKERGIVEVPEDVVLRTDYNRNSKDGRPDEGWDARLAVMLVKECLKGEESNLSG